MTVLLLRVSLSNALVCSKHGNYVYGLMVFQNVSNSSVEKYSHFSSELPAQCTSHRLPLKFIFPRPRLFIHQINSIPWWLLKSSYHTGSYLSAAPYLLWPVAPSCLTCLTAHTFLSGHWTQFRVRPILHQRNNPQSLFIHFSVFPGARLPYLPTFWFLPLFR